MPVREVFVHHFRLPRRGEEMAHFLFRYAFAWQKLLQFKLEKFFISKYCYFKRVSAAVRMFRMSMARVMGPTPPGTGVM